MSCKAEVHTSECKAGVWTSNELRFATEDEAKAYSNDLYGRWSAVRGVRTVESGDPVNYEWKDGQAYSLEGSS